MSSLLAFLDGKKTYLVVLIGAGIIASYSLGYITLEIEQQLLALFGFAGIASVRYAISQG